MNLISDLRLPTEQAQELRKNTPVAPPPELPERNRGITAHEAATERAFQATIVGDIGEVRNGGCLPTLPPVEKPVSPAQIEAALKSDPALEKAYEKLTPAERKSFLDLAAASWIQGSKGGGLFPAMPASLDPNLAALLREGKLSQKDGQGHSLLQNLEHLHKQKMASGMDSGQALRDTLMALRTAKEGLAKERPAEFARLVCGLTSPEGTVKLENGETIHRPAGFTFGGGGFMMGEGITPLVDASLQRLAGQHRGSIPQAKRQEAILSALKADPKVWHAFEKLSADDRSRFLELADTDALKDGMYVGKAESLKSGVHLDPNLLKLLTSGKLSNKDTHGKSLLENLLSLKSEKCAAPYRSEQVLSEALATLAAPEGCGKPESTGGLLAKEHPAEYIRLLSGLVSPSGSVDLKGGAILHRQAPAGGGMFGGLGFVAPTAADMLEASLDKHAETVATGPDQAERRAAIRKQLLADPQVAEKFKKLSAHEQEQFVALADSGAAARHGEVRKELGLKPTPIDPNLLKLLMEGKLGTKDSKGHSLLDNLTTLATQPYPPPLNADKVLGQVMHDLADPFSIHQGNRGTCTVTSMQFLLAKKDPAEYARIVAGVTSMEGKVEMRGGGTLQRLPEYLPEDGSGRDDVGRVLQSTLMDFGDGDLVYHNRGEGEHGTVFRLPDGTVIEMGPRPGGGGLYDEEWNKVASQLLEGPTRVEHPRTNQAETLKALEAALARGPILVALRWPSPTEPRGGHMLVLERIENGQAFLRNPWGADEHGGDGKDGSPVRHVPEGGKGGEVSMSVAELLKFLSAFAVPA